MVLLRLALQSRRLRTRQKRKTVEPKLLRKRKVFEDKEKKAWVASVVVVESKGKYLKRSEDTNYKRKVAGYFEKVGQKVPWQKPAKEFQH